MNERLKTELARLGLTGSVAPTHETWKTLLEHLSHELTADEQRLTALEASVASACGLQHAVLAALPDLYFHLSATDTFIDFRAGKMADLALPPEMFIGRRLQDLPFEAPLTTSFVRAATQARTSNVVAAHAYSLLVNGDLNDYEVRFSPLPQGELVALIRNHTRARRLEEELKLAQFSIDRFSDAAFWLTPDGVIAYANAAASRGLQYARADLVGRRYAEVAPEMTARAWPRLWSELRVRESLIVESKHQRVDGTTFHTEVALSHMEYAGREYACAIARDVTERRHVEESLVLTHRMASIGTLAASVAHEVNNPLAYMTMNLAHVARHLDKPDGPRPDELSGLRTAMEQAREGAERVRLIVRDLRTFSRGDDTRVDLVDVRPVLLSAITVSQNEIRHRAQVLTHFEDVPMVDASDARLGQVFLNLLINAAQAFPTADVRKNEIHVSARAKDDGDVEVMVRDNGPGIPKHVLAQVFEPFFTTKPVGVGTGLGLSISAKIVRGFHGTIEAESEPGSGATFRVTLPASARTRPSSTTMLVAKESHTRRARVLVVDDEPFITDALVRALADHDVVTCANGRDALAACDDAEFDVIFCDLLMPDIDGIELFERLRREQPGRESRMVFMTGGVLTSRVLDVLGSVDNRILEKPFPLEEALAIVETARSQLV